MGVANVGATIWAGNGGGRVTSGSPARNTEVAEALLALNALLWADVEVVAYRACYNSLQNLKC